MSFTFSCLKGKTFVVTGAPSGMGKAVSIMLAEQVVNVGLSNIAPADHVAKTISEIPGGGQSLVVKASVTNQDEVAAAIDQVVAKFGRLDGAANMAGIVGSRKLGDTGYVIERLYTRIGRRLSALISTG